MDALSLKPQVDLFEQSMDELDLLLSTIKTKTIEIGGPVDGSEELLSKTIKGLSFVMMFCAYENLVKGIVRALLETASTFKGKVKSLQSGIVSAALYPTVQAICDCKNPSTRMFKTVELNSLLDQNIGNLSISDVFPENKKYMDHSQVKDICQLFSLDDPGPIVQWSWGKLDTVRRNRNSVAHGSRLPSDVGSQYSTADICEYSAHWRKDWIRFASSIEAQASDSSFWLK